MKTRVSDIRTIGRLLKRADFLRLQGMGTGGTGRKWVTPNVIVQMSPFPAPAPDFTCRYGLTLTKKIMPHAVDRNRVRRRYRALFLSVIGDFPAVKGHDFVLLPRRPALTADADTLEKDLRWALKRLTAPSTARAPET